MPVPPGFGAPVPAGFACTVAAYQDWLVAELEALGEPVDFVGHDVGGGCVMTVAMTRPDLLRTWVSDCLGVVDPGYAWHDLARQWRTPTGRRAPGGQGPEMSRAILAFYRSAAQPVIADLGRNLPAAAARPGLAILPTEDHFVGSEPIRRRSAARAGARTETLDGLGHWWMVQDAPRGARALTSFWAHPSGQAPSPSP